jgi:hypothetical protein
MLIPGLSRLAFASQSSFSRNVDRDSYALRCNGMKIFSHYATRRNEHIAHAVFESQKEIPAK